MADSDVPSSGLIPFFPDEISIQILARIPRAHYRCLRLVSRSWRTALVSAHLFAVRSSVTFSTEPALCINIRTQTHQSSWLVLERGCEWGVFLPSPPVSTLGSACCVTGPFVFVLGGSVNGVCCNMVQILDLRGRGKWSFGPRMSTAREFAASNVINGRIYTIGGCLPHSESWAESLDPFEKNPKWVPIPSPENIREKWMHGCVVLSNRLLAMADRGGVSYDPSQESPWGSVPKRVDLGWKGRAAVVDEILYTYDYTGKIKGYDPKTDKWRRVLGLDKHLPKFLCGATLVGFDGILCLIWENKNKGNNLKGRKKEMVVDWAGIRVVDLGEEGLVGSILWWETVALGLPNGSSIAHCLVTQF
ncbi:hypothetical protein LUZ60_008072 [Juncus effusus]|nr:hypothetical protein LUZ60_008072 [Juncus effusus]